MHALEFRARASVLPRPLPGLTLVTQLVLRRGLLLLDILVRIAGIMDHRWVQLSGFCLLLDLLTALRELYLA